MQANCIEIVSRSAAHLQTPLVGGLVVMIYGAYIIANINYRGS